MKKPQRIFNKFSFSGLACFAMKRWIYKFCLKNKSARELDSEIEREWVRMEYDAGRTTATSGKNARLIFLGFIVTVNIAFYHAFYVLFAKKEFSWIILLGTIILLINFLIYLLYIREYRAEEDSFSQLKLIRDKLMRDSGYNNFREVAWFYYDEDYRDPFRNFTQIIVIIIFSLLVSLSIVVVTVGLKRFPSIFTKDSIEILVLYFIVFFVLMIMYGFFRSFCKNKMQ
jgi:hypothetical protein